MKLIPSPLPSKWDAEQTDSSRDRVIDTLRAFSIMVVVFGHVFMALVVWRGDVPELGNVLAGSKKLQLMTWVLQVMPLFFFAGGASSAISWRRRNSLGYGVWLWGRASRLLRPLWVYLAVMAPLAFVVALFSPPETSAPLLLLTTQLLWFLGAYLSVIAILPMIIYLHERNPVGTLISLIAISAAVDLARFAYVMPATIGLVNFVSVWAVAALLGVWYVDKKLQGIFAVFLALAGLASNVALVALGPYPLSMVGMPGEKISNMAPPTIALLAHTFWISAVAAAAAPLIRKIAQNTTLWRGVIAVNLSAMTIYLWHLPVLIALTVAEKLTGLTAPTRSSDGIYVPARNYWSWWGIHAFLFIAGVMLVVRFLWVSENIKLPIWDSPSSFKKPKAKIEKVIAITGVVACGVALLMLAATGLAGFPTRVVNYAGVPLNSGLALAILVLGGTFVRLSGAVRVPKQDSA